MRRKKQNYKRKRCFSLSKIFTYRFEEEEEDEETEEENLCTYHAQGQKNVQNNYSTFGTCGSNNCIRFPFSFTFFLLYFSFLILHLHLKRKYISKTKQTPISPPPSLPKSQTIFPCKV